MKIPDRITIRMNEREKLKFQQLGQYLHEEDVSKILKGSIDIALHHLDYVTRSLIDPSWDVVFMKKRKTQELKRKLYD